MLGNTFLGLMRCVASVRLATQLCTNIVSIITLRAVVHVGGSVLKHDGSAWVSGPLVSV